jgi:hypothetical protein
MADPDQRTRIRSRNIGGGVVLKVRSTQASFGTRNIGGGVIFKVRSTKLVLAASFGTITKADPLEVDPTAK